MPKTKVDISFENFDLYFDRCLPLVTPQAKEGLPKDITFKIFRKGGEVNSKSTSKLSFLAKLFILWKALKKRVYVIVEEENGMGVDEFNEYRDGVKRRELTVERATGAVTQGYFVTGNKELCDTLQYMNYINVSPAYNYLIKTKNSAPNRVTEAKKKSQYIIRMLSYYEAQKKKWVSEMGLEIPEYLILAYMYHREGDVPGAPLYKEFYKRAYQSSPTKLRRTFSVLQNKRLLEKTNDTKNAKYRITALGVNLIDTILAKYVLNC